MSIVNTAVDVHGSGDRRVVYYHCTDHLGTVHQLGPIFAGPEFDANAYATVAAQSVAEELAEVEAQRVIGHD